MTELDLFPLKTISETEPLVTDPFYAWLDSHAKKGDHVSDMTHIMNYLDEQGFVKGQHRIEESQLKILEYVVETWYRFTPWCDAQPMSALFDDSDPKFFLWNDNSRVGITPFLKGLLNRAGWIYDPHPDNTFFEIIKGRLYAKYQTILGDRYLCNIEEFEK